MHLIEQYIFQLKTHPSAFFFMIQSLKICNPHFSFETEFMSDFSNRSARKTKSLAELVRINAGLPVSTQNALGWLEEDLGGTFFFFFFYVFIWKWKLCCPCSMQMEDRYIVLPLTLIKPSAQPISHSWSSIRHPLAGARDFAGPGGTCLRLLCSFLILALCWH